MHFPEQSHIVYYVTMKSILYAEILQLKDNKLFQCLFWVFERLCIALKAEAEDINEF